MKFDSTYQEELTNLEPSSNIRLYIAPQRFMSYILMCLKDGTYESSKLVLPIDVEFETIINSYTEVNGLQDYPSKVHCRFLRIAYQKIKRMAKEGVPNAQEVADRLAILFEDPMHYQFINIKGNPHAKLN